MIVMVDKNCPQWDIADPSQALRFSTFLIAIRTRLLRDLKAEFKKIHGGLVEGLKKATEEGGVGSKASRRFRWKLTQQREEEPLKSMLKALKKRTEAEKREASKKDLPPLHVEGATKD